VFRSQDFAAAIARKKRMLFPPWLLNGNSDLNVFCEPAGRNPYHEISVMIGPPVDYQGNKWNGSGHAAVPIPVPFGNEPLFRGPQTEEDLRINRLVGESVGA